MREDKLTWVDEGFEILESDEGDQTPVEVAAEARQ